MLNLAVKIACKLLKMDGMEGCNLIAYPDPGSDLYKALSAQGMLRKYMRGEIKWGNLPKHLQAASGAPWTCGWGETKGVTKDTVWTQQEADERLEKRVKEFAEGVLKISPALATGSAEKLAAVTSLSYNIGLSAYKTSTVAKKIAIGDAHGAAQAFLLWNKSKGTVLAGLVNRRKIEHDLFLSKG